MVYANLSKKCIYLNINKEKDYKNYPCSIDINKVLAKMKQGYIKDIGFTRLRFIS